jgi:Zn-dependent peptidase ImmA (M78 family)
MSRSGIPRARQRFTLAHELSHIILGTTPDVSSVAGGRFMGISMKAATEPHSF